MNKMLKPTKYTKVKYSTIYIAGLILKYIQKENIVNYEDLKKLIVASIGVKAKTRINVSLTFLFSIGKIEYIKELDAIALLDENEIINENS